MTRLFGRRFWSELLVGISAAISVASCAAVQPARIDTAGRLREAASLVEEVKSFGKSIGIEPTEALVRTSTDAPPLSMLWLWLQRAGTLAIRAPIDIRMAIGFSMPAEQLNLEQVYRVAGYSLYYRQGNEFADDRSIATLAFAEQGRVRRVKVILHEDLHGPKNFDLPWEVEESIVTPLGSLAAVEFFRHKGDKQNLAQAVSSLEEERKFSQELNCLASEAERIFRAEPIDNAKQAVLALIPSFPNYNRYFQRQIAGQNPSTVLEAKLSHDLAYYRFYDQVVSLRERAGSLRRLIEDLKKLPAQSNYENLEKYLSVLAQTYSAAAN